MRAPISALAAALLLGALPLSAAAQTIDPRRCSLDDRDACLDGVGSGVTSLDNLRLSGERISGSARGRDEEAAGAQARLGAPGRRGMSAGEGYAAGWNLWASYAHSDSESDVRVAPYEATAHNLLFGADRLLGERWILGLALGYERTDTDTIFNGGTQDRDGYTVAPYAAFLINDVFSLDVSAGYTHLETDQTRIDPDAASPLPFITSDFAAERGFVTSNLNATWLVGDWVIGAVAGFVHAAEIQDSYREQGGSSRRAVRSRRVELTQGYLGADLAYSLGAWEPYAVAMYRNDFSRQDGSGAGGLPAAVGSTQPDDDDELNLGLGVRYFGRGGLSGSLEWITTRGRSHFDDDTISLTLRLAL